MATTTDNLTLTYLIEGQQLKEQTINANMEIIDDYFPRDLGEYTVANLPTASDNPNAYALATNASGGRTIVRSNGTNWKVIVVEGATVST